MKIGFLGTGHFAANILSNLIKTSINIDYIIIKKNKLKEYNIKTIAIQNKIRLIEFYSINSQESILMFKNINFDIILMTDYGEKLCNEIINQVKFGILNIHPSILPFLRGATPIQSAIINNFTETGISIIKINDKIDEGDLLKVNKCKIENTDTYDSLSEKLVKIAINSICDLLLEIELKKFLLIKQDNQNNSYTFKLSKDFYKINWNESATLIERKIRATYSIKYHFSFINGYRINIIKAYALNKNLKNNFEIGAICYLSNNFIDIVTGEGILRIENIRFSGKNTVSIRDVLNSKNNFFYLGNKFY